jgi:undecaprenyl-diphosphatase
MATRSHAGAPVWPRDGTGAARRPRADDSYSEAAVQRPDRHPERDFALSIALLALMLCGLLASVALALWAHDVPHSWKDVSLEAAVRAHMSPPFTAFIYAVSRLGDSKGIAATMALLLGWFALRRRLAQAVTLLTSVLGGTAIALTFKPLVGRLGPGATSAPTGPFAFNSYAFPSGHAVYFITCCVPLIWFLWEWRPEGALDWRILAHCVRTLACVGLLAVVALGGFSQIYLAYHWPSDVAGGYAIGGFWTGLVLLAYMRFRRGVGARWSAAPRQRELPVHPHL